MAARLTLWTRARVALLICTSAIAIAVAACGGGGGATPPATPAPNPVGTASVPLPAGGGTLALPAAAGFRCSMLVTSFTPGGVQATITTQATLPAGVPALQLRRRPLLPTVNNTGIFYLSVSFSATTTMAGFPGFDFTLPAGMSVTGPFNVALFDPTNPAIGWSQVLGPGSVSGRTVTFASLSSPYVFASTQTYVFALYIPGPPSPAFKEFSLPVAPSTEPVTLASGPDHNIWFTVCQSYNTQEHAVLNGWIGRLTIPANAVTLFQIPNNGTQRCPAEITSGPDGNLWFTEFDFQTGGTIGRITTSGVITEYPLPTMQGVTGIATGADGNIWISGTPVAGNFTIAAVSPSTQTIVKSAFIPTAQGNPGNLISYPVDGSIVATGYNEAGPSDMYSVNTLGTPVASIVAAQGSYSAAFWTMHASGANVIFVPNTIAVRGGSWSMLTLSGHAYTPNIVPGLPGNNQVQGIAYGPDGNLYLADDGQSPNTGAVYVMSTSGGVIGDFQILSPGIYPFQSKVGFGNPMVVGPDGNIYFAESANQKLGEIVLTP